MTLESIDISFRFHETLTSCGTATKLGTDEMKARSRTYTESCRSVRRVSFWKSNGSEADTDPGLPCIKTVVNLEKCEILFLKFNNSSSVASIMDGPED